MIVVHDVKLKVGQLFIKLPPKIENRLHIPKGSVESVRMRKRSLDARKKPDLYWSFSLEIESQIPDEELLEACKRAGIKAEPYTALGKTVFPIKKPSLDRPVVVGFGPCGLFAALALCRMGLKPLVLERGASMDERVAAVERFWETGRLDPCANVQFGEGGAGTFSDGKLTTGTRSEYRSFVLESFVDCGAPADILFVAKPHIGTDVLRNVVVALREKIEELGGEIRFRSQLSELIISGEENEKRIEGVKLSSGEEIKTTHVILALGHSARDTVRTLFKQGVEMEQKPFSMGIRIEHPQRLIDIAQYGKPHEEFEDFILGPADYKLNVKTKDGRGVYTFCMCPGGYVVNASSFEGMVVTNGMSNSNRGNDKANSALLCDVRTSDFGSDDVLAGVDLQEKCERLAYVAGGSNYRLPKEKLRDFESEKSLLKTCLPDFVHQALCEALPSLDKKLKGFANPDATAYGIESRSSSPVRLLRNEDLQAVGIKGLYPAGEGAGYAGGIMSAACDGIKAAFKLGEDYE